MLARRSDDSAASSGRPIHDQSGASSARPSHDHDLSDASGSSHGHNEDDDDDDDDDDDGQATKSTWYLMLLTMSIGGLQIVWSVELASITPFLLSLGLSKALMALVWIAGPLSGTLVQPYVGIRSDACRLRYGRRRPFMIGGAVATMASLLALAWTREVVDGVASMFGGDADSTAVTVIRQVYATLFVYVLDFAINVIQAAIRAFIVDCAPTHQQEAANAWANRMTGIGNIVGYTAGFIYIPSLVPFVGKTQFQALTTLACLILASTLAVSCWRVPERDPRLLGPPRQASRGVLGFFVHLYRAVARLPPQIRRVCQVQLFAWVGWFPFLFYTSTYVGSVYAEPYFRRNPHMEAWEVELVWQQGTQLGSLALLVFAVSSFLTSMILPVLVTPAYADVDAYVPDQDSLFGGTALPLDEPSSNSHARQSRFSFFASAYKKTATTSRRLARRLDLRRLRIPGFTLRRAWLLSHLLACAILLSTWFVSSTTGAVVLVGLVGLPWAVTTWAPFALIATEISEREAARRRAVQEAGHKAPSESRARGDDVFLERDDEFIQTGHDNLLASPSTQPESSSAPSKQPPTTTTTAPGPGDQAGLVLGIHNVAIAAPQVVATLGSSLIFWVLQRPRGQPGDASVGWVLRLGGLCMLGAAWMTARVAEPGRHSVRLSAKRGRGEALLDARGDANERE